LIVVRLFWIYMVRGISGICLKETKRLHTYKT
jgi:hypothetical protein